MNRTLGPAARSASELAALTCALALLGCGGSDDDASSSVPTTKARAPGGSSTTNPTPVSGTGAGSPQAGAGSVALPAAVSEGAALSSLDADTALGVCDALEARFDATFGDADAERLSCALFGVLFSAASDGMGGATVDVATCRQLEQECLASGGELSSMTRCDAAGFADAAAGCSLTVGEYADCFEAQLSALVELLDVVSCDAASDGSVLAAATTGGDPSTLPACEAFVAQCPDLVTPPDDGSGSTDMPAADGCDETCVFAGDDECDDGGAGSSTPVCALGTDCADCGPR